MAQLVLFSSGDTNDTYEEWVVIDTKDMTAKQLLNEYGPGKVEDVIPITHSSVDAWPTDRGLADPSN